MKLEKKISEKIFRKGKFCAYGGFYPPYPLTFIVVSFLDAIQRKILKTILLVYINNVRVCVYIWVIVKKCFVC